MGRNLETTAVYHFLKVTDSLDSLELALGDGLTVSGVESRADVTTDCLSSLSNSHSLIKHLRLINLLPSQFSKIDLSIFMNLRILSLDFLMLQEMKTGNLGSSLSSVQILHLPFYVFEESQPRDDDFVEERFLSDALLKGVLPNLAEIVLPSKPIGVDCEEAESSRSVRLWKEGRKALRENENIKSGKAKLRTLEVGETGEWKIQTPTSSAHQL